MKGKYALLLGSKSDISMALAECLAADGYNLYLGARNSLSMEKNQADISIRFGVDVRLVEFDALDYASHPLVYSGLQPKPELVCCFVGLLPDQDRAEGNPSIAIKTMETNYIGCASILEQAAQDMEKKGSGTIVGISSVAGDRGRASNYFYGSAKAGFSSYLSGLRNRLYKKGVHVLTVKPGFVYTSMTEDKELPAKLTAQPEAVAKDILRAIKKKKNVLYTPWFWKYIMLIIRNIPEFIFKKLSL